MILTPPLVNRDKRLRLEAEFDRLWPDWQSDENYDLIQNYIYWACAHPERYLHEIEHDIFMAFDLHDEPAFDTNAEAERLAAVIGGKPGWRPGSIGDIASKGDMRVTWQITEVSPAGTAHYKEINNA